MLKPSEQLLVITSYDLTSVPQQKKLFDFMLADDQKYIRLGGCSAGNNKDYPKGYTIYAVRVKGHVHVFRLPYCDKPNIWVKAKGRSWNV